MVALESGELEEAVPTPRPRSRSTASAGPAALELDADPRPRLPRRPRGGARGARAGRAARRARPEHVLLLESRAALRLAEGEPEAALADALEATRLAPEVFGVSNARLFRSDRSPPPRPPRALRAGAGARRGALALARAAVGAHPRRALGTPPRRPRRRRGRSSCAEAVAGPRRPRRRACRAPGRSRARRRRRAAGDRAAPRRRCARRWSWPTSSARAADRRRPRGAGGDRPPSPPRRAQRRRRAHPERAPRRRPRRPGPLDPADRPPPLHHPQDGGEPPRPGLSQARRSPAAPSWRRSSGRGRRKDQGASP